MYLGGQVVYHKRKKIPVKLPVSEGSRLCWDLPCNLDQLTHFVNLNGTEIMLPKNVKEATKLLKAGVIFPAND